MADLTLDACDHLMDIWKICYKCETTIGENQVGFIYGCNCLSHYQCPVPRVRECHFCSLEFKQQLITNYVKKTFSTDDVKGAYKRYMKNNFLSIINERNPWSLTKEDCNLLMMCWRICFLCETKVEGGSNLSNAEVGWIYPCQCLCQIASISCPVPRVRESHHSSACSLQLKMEIVTNYVRKTYQTDNAKTAFEIYMRMSFPGLLDEAVKQISRPVQCLPSTLVDGVELGPPSITLTPISPEQKKIIITPQPVEQVVEQLSEPSPPLGVLSEPGTTELEPTLPQQMVNGLAPFEDFDVIYLCELKIGRCLGAGAYGTVHLASDEFHTMAVKQLRPLLPSNSEELRKELNYLIQVCRHPNLVHVRAVLYDHPEKEKTKSLPIGFTMEFMSGGSLSDVIHSDPRTAYDIKQILKWIKQAACGLHYLHGKKIIHRDVKPQNMLLDGNHEVLKICDLGVSSIIQTLQTAVRGTFVYMAPEVMSEGEKTSYSELCDVYSLAICMWEMHHRQFPFGTFSHGILTLANNVREGVRPTIAEDCDSELSDLICRSWAPEVADRPTMRDIHTFTVNSLRRLAVNNEI